MDRLEVLSIDVDLMNILGNADFDVRMTDIVLPASKMNELNEKLEDVCKLILEGLHRKLYSIQESEGDE